MLERIKEHFRKKPSPPPQQPPKDAPINETYTSTELLAMNMYPLRTAREAVLIEITKSKRPMKPRDFIQTHWPYMKRAGKLVEIRMLQRAVLIPFRALRSEGNYRLLKVPLQDGWLFYMGTNTCTEQPTEPAEMYVYLDDPDWELVDNLTHQLTPKGSLLVKRVCLATMSSIQDYHFVDGIVYLRLKPPVEQDLYSTIAEAANTILGNK